MGTVKEYSTDSINSLNSRFFQFIRYTREQKTGRSLRSGYSLQVRHRCSSDAFTGLSVSNLNALLLGKRMVRGARVTAPCHNLLSQLAQNINPFEKHIPYSVDRRLVR
jgi:hypothetical protein